MNLDSKNIPLLKILSPRERREFLKWTQTKIFEPGDLIFKKGDKRKEFFVILQGQVELFQSIEKQEDVFDVLSVGDFMVETALTEPGTYHTLSAKAKTKTQVLSLNFQAFKNLEELEAGLTLKILKYIALVLSERLYHADNKLITLYRTGKIMAGTQEIQSIADRILSAIFEVIKAKRGFFAVLTLNNKIHIQATLGFSKTDNLKNRKIKLEDDFIFQQISQTKKTLLLKDGEINQQKNQRDKNQQAKQIINWPDNSTIITPIVISNQVRALIALFDKQTGEFNLNNQVLLEAIADQLAASLVLKELWLSQKAAEEMERVYY